MDNYQKKCATEKSQVARDERGDGALKCMRQLTRACSKALSSI